MLEFNLEEDQTTTFSTAALVRRYLPEIDAAQAAGTTNDEILASFQRGGVEIPRTTFESALSRHRKKLGKRRPKVTVETEIQVTDNRPMDGSGNAECENDLKTEPTSERKTKSEAEKPTDKPTVTEGLDAFEEQLRASYGQRVTREPQLRVEARLAAAEASLKPLREEWEARGPGAELTAEEEEAKWRAVNAVINATIEAEKQSRDLADEEEAEAQKFDTANKALDAEPNTEIASLTSPVHPRPHIPQPPPQKLSLFARLRSIVTGWG